MPRRTLLAAALAALCVLAGCAGFLPGGHSDGGANATQPYETPISTADVQTALDDAGSYRGVIIERDHRENTTFPRATSVTRHTVVANTTSGERLVRTILTNHENDTFDRTSYQPAEGVGYVNRTFEGETEFRLAGPDARTPVRGTLRAVGNVSFAYNGTVHRDGRTLHHYRGTGTSNPALHRNGSDPLRSASLLVTPDGVPVEFRFVWATDFGELTVSLSLADLGSASVPRPSWVLNASAALAPTTATARAPNASATLTAIVPVDDVGELSVARARGETDFALYANTTVSPVLATKGTRSAASATLTAGYNATRVTNESTLAVYTPRRWGSLVALDTTVDASANTVSAQVAGQSLTEYAVMSRPAYERRHDFLTENVTRTLRTPSNATLTLTAPRSAFHPATRAPLQPTSVPERYMNASVSPAVFVTPGAGATTLSLPYDASHVANDSDFALIRSLRYANDTHVDARIDTDANRVNATVTESGTYLVINETERSMAS